MVQQRLYLLFAASCVGITPAQAVNDFAPDPGFGTGGRTLVGSLGPVRDEATSVAASLGAFGLIGSTQSGSPVISSARLDANGQPNNAFGNQGFLITAANGTPVLGASVFDSQGRLLAVTRDPQGVARFSATGILDTSFAGDGVWNPGDASVVFDIALGPGDSVWVSKSVNQFLNAQLIQLSASGVQTAYTGPGNMTFGFIPFGYARLHREADGGFWWAARATTDPFDQVIARFTASGGLDTSYSGDGFTRAPVPCIAGQNSRAYQSFTVLPGGIAVVRGDHDGGAYLVAVFLDGTAGPARCEDANGVIAKTREIAPRDAGRFVAASSHCRADGACGALLRQFVVQPAGTVADDPPGSIDVATQFFATTDGSLPAASGNDVIFEGGKPVMVGVAAKTATDADFFAIRYVASSLFADGFE